MKKFGIYILGIVISSTSFAQESEEVTEEDKKPKKIETIRIIDGDTVVHDVRIIESDGEHHRRIHRHIERDWDSGEIDDELEELMNELDVYVHLDDEHKKRIIKRIEFEGDDTDEILEEFDIDEDIIIEMEEGDGKMKVMKIKIEDDDIDDVTTIEMDGRKGRKHLDRIRKHGDSPTGLHAFPNPAKDHLNVDFEVLEGSTAELTVTGANGEQIFSKSYKKPGKYHEEIKTDVSGKGIYIINLNQDERSLSEKIIFK